MPHRPRRRAVLKWTGASLCALIFAAWFASRWFMCSITHRQPGTFRAVSLGRGCVSFDRTDDVNLPSVNAGWGTYERALPPKAVGWAWQYFESSHAIAAARARVVLVPLYFPFGLVSLPTIWLFYRDRRSVQWARAGRCMACGYDPSGLQPGAACPECGKGGPA